MWAGTFCCIAGLSKLMMAVLLSNLQVPARCGRPVVVETPVAGSDWGTCSWLRFSSATDRAIVQRSPLADSDVLDETCKALMPT